MGNEFNVGDEVYYVKKSYGKHKIESFNEEKTEVLLSTPRLTGEGNSLFWCDIGRIIKKCVNYERY